MSVFPTKGWLNGMSERHSYSTKQRRIVEAYLTQYSDRYLSVDDIFAALHTQAQSVSRTTVYRTLETLVREAKATKVVAPGTSESRYRLVEKGSEGQGQFVCLECGRTFPLDCDMLGDLKEHVRREHGFCINLTKTVLYGYCSECMS